MAKQLVLKASVFDFLDKLKKNNNREWFNAHKDDYLQELAIVEQFAESLLQELKTHDEIETLSGKDSLYRIYRDTRFSKDKTPYKQHWAGSFKRATKYRRGGYYFHLEPGNTFVAGGFWGPEKEDLKRIREEIAFDATPLRKILQAKTFVNNFGALQGEQLKVMPKGYDAKHEAIDLLRFKQFILKKDFPDEVVFSGQFLKEMSNGFKQMRPFLDYMSDVLTTDINGESL
ncbi:DUF2461 domain-containing protein [Chitinophaga rhizophila]|uniref:DUF2461 domain-containing protein n=1 Tax=Chitinophaga rhizophila TaxID=2866212 RepID=A0ABS7GEJ4_9BACT|nr:DUF2461 domain-containing protein [Chitinophaga rhizophila]MBW8685580.1 DUF2461 domain-containing protein [Chitinophaga rhizophila]